jgi:hypothetical protein
VVDFTPRKVKKIFKTNYCNIGMAAGFVEPLDAPGLSMTIRNISDLVTLLKSNNAERERKIKNEQADEVYKD